jgi:hypothetical protein
MAKASKSKKRDISIHSRAARRAASPSLNTDKSLKSLHAPPSNPHVHIFAAQPSGGIRKKKTKALTRHQKQRQAKGLERADIVNAKIEVRVEKGEEKVKQVKERKKEWNRLNKAVLGEVGGMVGEKVVGEKRLRELDEEMREVLPQALNAGEEWEDVDDEVELKENKEKASAETIVVPIPADMQAQDIPLPDEDVDEIL